MNLICITESELSQWISRRYFDTLIARVLTGQAEVTRDIFSTAPYLKIDDARGRIVVNLKDDWKKSSSKINSAQNIEIISIPLDAIAEIAPAMDQYANRLETYKLPIATWSVERVWDEWLINQAVTETFRALITEVGKIGFIDKKTINDQALIKDLIHKALRPNSSSQKDSVLMGWGKVLEHRDDWIQALRVNGHLENSSMLNASVEIFISDLCNQKIAFDRQLIDNERGWEFQDITPETLRRLSRIDSEIIKLHTLKIPPFFCMASYLRLYDEIQNGNKDWRVIFNLLRFTKYTVSSLHSDLLTILLIASLKVEEIYSLNLKELYLK